MLCVVTFFSLDGKGGKKKMRFLTFSVPVRTRIVNGIFFLFLPILFCRRRLIKRQDPPNFKADTNQTPGIPRRINCRSRSPFSFSPRFFFLLLWRRRRRASFPRFNPARFFFLFFFFAFFYLFVRLTAKSVQCTKRKNGHSVDEERRFLLINNPHLGGQLFEPPYRMVWLPCRLSTDERVLGYYMATIYLFWWRGMAQEGDTIKQ